MKNLVLALLFLTIFIIGCGNDENDKSADKNTDVKENVTIKKETGPLVKMRYKFTKGDKFSYKLTTIANNKEEINADTSFSNSIIQTAIYNMNFVVKDVSEYNIADLEVRVNSIVAETDYNGQKLKYDSKFMYSKREKAQFVDYEAVKKVPFRISVNEIGQVLKVEKIDRIMRNFLTMQNIPDTLSTSTKEKMRMNIANGTLMPLTQQIFKVVAEKKVGVDSIWQLKYSTPLAIYNVENTAIFKVTNLDFAADSLVTISSSLVINVAGDDVLNEKGVKYTFVKPNLDAYGSVKYNLSRGLVENSESNTKLVMSMTMEGFDSSNKPLKSSKNDFSNNTNIVELL